MAHITAPPPTGEARGPGNDAPGQHQPDLGARGNEVKKLRNAFELMNNTNNLKGLRAVRSNMAPLAENLPRAHGAQHYTIPRTNHQGNVQQQARAQEEWQEPPQGNARHNDHQVPEAAMARQEGHGREDQHQPQQDGPGDGGYGLRVEVTKTKPKNPKQEGTNQTLPSGWGKEPTREQRCGTQQHDGRDPGAAAARAGAEGELRRNHGLQRDGGLQVHQRVLPKGEL